MSKQKNNFHIVPNTERILVKNISPKELLDNSSGLIMAGQLKAGDNLFLGEVVHAGDTKFKVGQIVYYSEYSAAQLFDVGKFVRNEASWSEVAREGLVVVAEDDIMAYEEGSDDFRKISESAQTNKPEAKS